MKPITELLSYKNAKTLKNLGLAQISEQYYIFADDGTGYFLLPEKEMLEYLDKIGIDRTNFADYIFACFSDEQIRFIAAWLNIQICRNDYQFIDINILATKIIDVINFRNHNNLQCKINQLNDNLRALGYAATK